MCASNIVSTCTRRALILNVKGISEGLKSDMKSEDSAADFAFHPLVTGPFQLHGEHPYVGK